MLLAVLRFVRLHDWALETKGDTLDLVAVLVIHGVNEQGIAGWLKAFPRCVEAREAQHAPASAAA